MPKVLVTWQTETENCCAQEFKVNLGHIPRLLFPNLGAGRGQVHLICSSNVCEA